MKLLFDENLSFKLCDQLADLFPGSSHIRRLGLQHAPDSTIWDHAGREGFVLVSLDADFAEMAALLGPPPPVIWLRCGNQRTEVVARKLREQALPIELFAASDLACLEIY